MAIRHYAASDHRSPAHWLLTGRTACLASMLIAAPPCCRSSCRSSDVTCLARGPEAHADTLQAITHVVVFDPAAGAVERHDMTIVLRGTRIMSVGPAASTDVPRDAIVHDGTGHFVMPGLWDAHVHLSQVGPRAFPLFIANGVTSVRDMGSNWTDIRQWRAARAAGAPIPRILSPGPKLDGGSFIRRLFSSGNREVRILTSPNDARRAVDELAAAGVDFIKVHNRITPDLYRAIIEGARKDDLSVDGHLPTSGPLAAAAARQRTIEHGRGMLFCSSETWARIRSDPRAQHDAEYCAPAEVQPLELSALRQAGSWLTPTLVSWRGNAMVGDPGLASWVATLSGDSAVWPALREHWQQMAGPMPTPFERELLAQFGPLAAAASRAGIPLLAGTDLGDPYVIPGYALHDELELMVAAGVPALVALQSATSEPARAFNLADSLGAIAAGQMADLLILDADPLADVRNTRRIAAVVLNGRWIAQDRRASIR